MKRVMIGIALAAVAAGCQSVYKNDGGDADLRPTIVRDVAYEKYDVKTTLVESIDDRIGFSIFFKHFVLGGVAGHYADNAPKGWFDETTVAVAKNGAYAAACEAARCDTLVGCHYTIEYTDYLLWDTAKVKVTGYPAKLIGVEFRKANLDCCCGKK